MLNALHPEDIKAVIRKAHGTVAAFEAANNLPGKSVHDLLRGRTSRRVTEAVEAELAKAEAFRMNQSERSDDTPVNGTPHRLNAAAR